MSTRDSLLIFLIGVIVFTIGLGPEFLGLDARFGMFVQEMLRNGPTFFPTTYDQPYPDYPATSTFLSYLASVPFGKVTTFSAILPTAVVSALILVVIYRIGAMHSRQWGLFAVLLALFTKEFFSLSRSISIDQYTTLVTVLCFYLMYSAQVYGRQKRLWFIPAFFAAGFAFRGPIGLVIPAAVVCAYYLYNRDLRKFLLMAAAAGILFLVCFKGLLLAAAYQGGTAFAERVWIMQMAGRVQDVSKHSYAYYWVDSFAKYALAYPFAVIVVIAMFKKIFKRENANYRLLACLVVWILVVLIGMSIPSTKKIRYVLPMIPAAALAASYMFIEPLEKGILSGVREIFLKFCCWFPAGAGIAALAIWALDKQYPALRDAHYLIVLFLMVALATAAHFLNTKLKEKSARALALTAVGVLTFIFVVVGIEEPISYSRDRTGPFVRQVEELRSQQPGEIVFYKISADGAAIKFMVNLDKPLKPQFIKTSDALLSFKIPAYFIAAKKDFDSLPQERVKLLADGKISHDDCVVFMLKQPDK
jgi:4-amino-4-deoxy-L-arabinose transferase-like glycosyltransferase